MREVLFKAKRVENGEWVEGGYVHQYGADMIYLPDGTDREYGFDYYHIDKETLCEFTGLRDKHGKRIWENDIVTAHFKSNRTKQTFRVIYDCGMFLFDNGYVKVNSWDIFSLKVIRNSIDNPELLTAERKE